MQDTKTTASTPELTINVVDLDDVENSVWMLTDLLHRLCDEIEAGEPLQAKQTFEQISAHHNAIGAYLNVQPNTTG